MTIDGLFRSACRVAVAAAATAVFVAPAGAQQGCIITGATMNCPNGVTIGGVGTSVIIGSHAMGEGTYDRKTPDDHEVHEFGNAGVVIGGRADAERLQNAGRPNAPP
jgi:hypothetical protein